MKILKLSFLMLIISQAQGQTITVKGTVVDSLSHKPISRAAILWHYNRWLTRSDTNGKFSVLVHKDSSLNFHIWQEGYFIKDQVVETTKQEVLISLVPIESQPDRVFHIRGKAKDTLLYPDKKIQKIIYKNNNYEIFYPSGQIKSKSVDGSTKNWYPNGQLQTQTIEITGVLKQEITWYENGQIKSKGTYSRVTKIPWIKNKDWKYYNKDGTVDKKRG